MEQSTPPVAIDSAKCPPCSKLVCIGTCPLGLLETAADGKPEVLDSTSCTRCGVCADLCPTKAITVRKARTSYK